MMRTGILQHIVLHKLTQEDLSGYGLCKKIEESCGQRPSYGSIYPLLERMRDERLVSVTTDGRKKVYSLTHEGLERAREVGGELDSLIAQTMVNVKALFEMTGQDPDPLIAMLEKFRAGKAPLGQATGSMLKLRDAMFRLAQKDVAERHSAEIKKILDTARKRLEDLG